MDLEKLRNEIDVIDDKILELFKKRMETVKQVAEFKQNNGVVLNHSSREQDILYRVCNNTDENIRGYTKILYNTIFDVSKAYQSSIIKTNTELEQQITKALQNSKKNITDTAIVACQGVEGAYSQIAASKIFDASKIIYMRTFDSVFNAVEKGLCEYGILPIENSTAGSVTEVYELMKKYKFFIAKSIKLRINHMLVAKQNIDIKDIKEIYSHEQAINQCSDFLKQNPNIKVTICENTAVAAMMVANSNRNDIAAISSKNCSDIYDLKILSSSIQNSDNNYTRFICISKNLEIYENANKISIMITAENKVGALYTLITKFSTIGLNLTKLESRPIAGTDFEFMFYFDIDGSVKDNRVVNLLSYLSANSSSFAFLGNYNEI